MDFDLTHEQKDIIKAAKACELGFEGVRIPETYGGGVIRVLEKKRLMNFRNPRRYYAETFKELTR
jgi:hypothetical protein